MLRDFRKDTRCRSMNSNRTWNTRLQSVVIQREMERNGDSKRRRRKRKESEETCQELNNATARLDGGEMCGTYAILSSDLFTLPRGEGRGWSDVNLFKRREACHERAGPRMVTPFLKFFATLFYPAKSHRVKSRVINRQLGKGDFIYRSSFIRYTTVRQISLSPSNWTKI